MLFKIDNQSHNSKQLSVADYYETFITEILYDSLLPGNN
jgi:hypothetical protein